jgi:hypothetical protein
MKQPKKLKRIEMKTILRSAPLLVFLTLSPSAFCADIIAPKNMTLCESAATRSIDINMLPICLAADSSSSDAMAIFNIVYYQLSNEKTNRKLKLLLDHLKPRLKEADYYYLLGLIEVSDNKENAKLHFEKASKLGSREASEYLYTFLGGGYGSIVDAYHQGSSSAKFQYALRLKNGSNGLEKDPKKAAQLIFDAALEGESAATTSVMEHKEWLSNDQIEFWSSTKYLSQGNTISDHIAPPRISNWIAYCGLLSKAKGIYASMPTYYDFNKKQKEHLLDVILQCTQVKD